jgi:hypothetical protein
MIDMQKKNRRVSGSLNNYLTFSILFHLIIVSFAILYVRDIRNVIHQSPHDWIIADKVILIEQFGQIPSKTVQIKRYNVKNKLPSYSKPEIKTNNTAKKSEAWGNINSGFIASVDAQFLAVKTKAFFNTMRKAAETLAAPIVTGADKTVLNGAYANVRLIYGENKNLENIEVSSETAELREALKKIDWHSAPLPADFLLSYKGINLKIGVNDSRILIGLEVI